MNIDIKAIHRAAETLESGKLVAFPTETVYGLGADAENPDALGLIFTLKRRPATHPLIVHVASGENLSYWADFIPDEAQKLIQVFWPGPLTLILKRSPRISAVVSGGQDTIGVRCPSHPVAQALLSVFKKGKGGIAAPSANLFGNVSPTKAQHVRDEFGQDSRLAQILDGGQSEVGIESTILDLSRINTHGPVLLRPGKISADDIASVIGKRPDKADKAAPRASGTLLSHYAPNTPVVLALTGDIPAVLNGLHKKGKRIALMHYSVFPDDMLASVFVRFEMPAFSADYSHQLYAVLRTLDEKGADMILVELPPLGSEWDGINDRLQRAAYDSRDVLKTVLS